MGNPLVARPVDSTAGYSGIPLAEDAMATCEGISSGSWLEGGLGALGLAGDITDTVANPFGALFAAGAGWLMEHFEPLRRALDWLAGKPDVIAAYGQTWDNVARELDAIRADHEAAVRADLTGWQGPAADAYRQTSAGLTDALTSASSVTDGLSTATTIMGSLVDMVRSTVRDLIARLVGDAVQWLLEEAFTLGLATPVVIGQVAAAVSNAMAKVSRLLGKVTDAIGKVTPLLKKLQDLFGKIGDKLRKLRSEGRAHTPEGGRAHVPDETPTARGQGTDPSGAHPGDPVDTARAPGDRPDCGDPVDPVTGHVFATQTDVELPGSLDLVLNRTHLSSYRSGRLFGPSWASTLDQRVAVGPLGIRYFTEDARVLEYPHPDGTDPVMPEHGVRWPLRRTGHGFTVSMPDEGRTLHFGVVGPMWAAGADRPLVAITTPVGGRIDLDYTDGQLSGLRHSGGYHIDVDTVDGRVTGLHLRPGTTGDESVGLAGYRYDQAGHLAEVAVVGRSAARFGYDDDGRLVSWTDGNDEWYRYHYDENGRCDHTEGKDGALDSRFHYEPERRTTVYTNALGHNTTFEYNELGHVVRETDPRGRTILSTWDRFGNLLSRADKLGRVTRYIRDEDGTFLGLTRADGASVIVERDDRGQVTRVGDTSGGSWHHEYDDLGRITATTTPAGATTRYGYGEDGHMVAVTDPVGGVTRIEPNAAGLPMAVTDPQGSVTRYERDRFGRITATIDPLGGSTRQGWTVGGNPLWRTLPDGSAEQWRYDSEGNLVAYIDAVGRTTRMTSTNFDRPATVTTPDDATTVYGYDAELRLTSVTNPQGLVWHYEYDDVGDLVRETDFNGHTTTYTWDEAGQLTTRTNAAGQRVAFEYDVLGNVVEQRSDDRVTRFGYDPAGNLVRAANPDTEVVIERDVLGRVIRETVDGRVVTSELDVVGRRTSRTTPSGLVSTWEYDSTDQVVALHSGGRTVRFDYDLAGREVRRQLPGAMLVHEWDPMHRLRAQSLRAAGRTVQQRGWRYRADGYVTGARDSMTGDREFVLDQLGRVTAAGRAESYGYDRAGNITQAQLPDPADDQAGPRAYTGTLLRSAGRTRYDYDAQGRVVARHIRTLSGMHRTWRFTWDAEDRLIETVTPDGRRWQYAYDPFGRRIGKRQLDSNGAVLSRVDFVWDGTRLAEQVHTSGGGTWTTTWDYHPDTGHPITQIDQGRLRGAPQDIIDRRFHAIVTDLVGTPTELVDPSGTVVWRHATTLWGGPVLPPQRTGPSCPLRFAGQYADEETGWHYNYFRYYDPSTGRYTSPDPLGLEGGENPHAYVPNPMYWTDPLGLSLCKRHVPESAMDHILKGEFKNGKTTGYHHREGGRDRHGWRTTKRGEADANGVYQGTATRRDWNGNDWVEKRAKSTFFPDEWSSAQVRHAVERAFTETKDINTRSGKWAGSHRGIRIEGWYDPSTGALKTAFPIRAK
ncbi:RHS repeat-associated core domain-containing protein [Actinokineospora enzanensis]|uniref:RHS repeat-associated core domain-containing protein n=1 Tax=Actinokineospora enzanensis TaxID=155975 RepID=UPI0003A08C51|nr:RHS repeat-associated core domain-containing protein [Actinokineospora enzanensis]